MKKLVLFLSVLFSICMFNGCESESESGSGSNGLEGTWYLQNSSGCIAEVIISGSTGTITKVLDISGQNSMSTWVSAVKKRIVTNGTPYFKNLQSAGNNKWTCSQMAIEYNSVPEATGLQYLPATITKDGSSLNLAFTSNPTLRSGWLVKSGCSNTKEFTLKTGTVSFWTSNLYYGKISVTFNGKSVGTLSTARQFNGAPTCGGSETLGVYNVAYGTYSYSATSTDGHHWEGDISVSESCTVVNVLNGRY
ncbi:hypothetical protein FACS189434_05700 [Bacteroidia bacterium]|nr:hypothetical protein FACS189434_05700 [Bacteroidia bacterium]